MEPVITKKSLPTDIKSKMKYMFKHSLYGIVSFIVGYILECCLLYVYYITLEDTVEIKWTLFFESSFMTTKEKFFMTGAFVPFFLFFIGIAITLILCCLPKPIGCNQYWKEDKNNQRFLIFLSNWSYLTGFYISVLFINGLFPIWRYNLLCNPTKSHTSPCTQNTDLLPQFILLLVGLLIAIIVIIKYLVLIQKWDNPNLNLFPEQAWHFKIFYFNSQDSSYNTKYPGGFGKTQNFAHTKSWINNYLIIVLILTFFDTLYIYI
ncbi:hypothetical protein WA158_005255 [Blastocystis sp. Blastoise]